VHIDLDAALIRAALASANALPEETWPAVNVSGDLLRRPRELEPLPAESARPLILEISDAEGADLDNLPAGVRIAVDDAGAGYDTLARMESLKPGFLELGRASLAGVEAEGGPSGLDPVLGGIRRRAQLHGHRRGDRVGSAA
jgi:EAL domain-containing protein (putative c-di-GMP-specific phosphodiesterase class I)